MDHQTLASHRTPNRAEQLLVGRMRSPATSVYFSIRLPPSKWLPLSRFLMRTMGRLQSIQEAKMRVEGMKAFTRSTPLHQVPERSHSRRWLND